MLPPRGDCSAMAPNNARVLVRRRLECVHVDRTAYVDKLEDDNEKNPEEVSKTKILTRESLSLEGRRPSPIIAGSGGPALAREGPSCRGTGSGTVT